jgi:uncharacterized protein
VIHCFQAGGHNVVVDGNSGSIHICDDLTYDIIAFREGADAELALALVAESHPDITETELTGALAEISALVQSGQLYSAPPIEPEVIEERGQIHSGVVKALCLNVSHACNMRCAYCFAAKANGDGELMSFEVGKAALDFLIANSGHRRNLEVDFFGGEPLLNWEVVKRLVKYARSAEMAADKHFRFTLTTNGLDLTDEVLAFANREFQTVVLSLDGRKETHDRFRKLPDGTGSYVNVAKKISGFVKNRVGEYYIRATYTRENLDFVNDLTALNDLGFEYLSIEPVVCGANETYSLKDTDLNAILGEYDKLAEVLQKRKFNFYHFNLDLENGPCLNKRLSGCGSGSEYMAVTPDGGLYPCHRFVGDEKFIIGNVFEGVTRPDIVRQFASNNVFTNPECGECWAKLWCAGGCAANTYYASGNPGGIYKFGCELFKKRLEKAIQLAAGQ